MKNQRSSASLLQAPAFMHGVIITNYELSIPNYFDVDHFKSFNDTFGHSAGDAVLRELGQFLQSHIRKSDIACRYGGEELTLIMPETSLEVVLERSQAIREGVKRLQVQHHRQLLGKISLSLGVAMFPKHGVTGEAVLRAADAALYRAKQSGRDRVMIYE